jgi:hypothetical protein
VSNFIIAKLIIIKSNTRTDCQFRIFFKRDNQSLCVLESVEFYHFFRVQIQINSFDRTEIFLKAINYREVAVCKHFLEDRSHRPYWFGEVETARNGIFNEEIKDSLFDKFDVIDI